MPRAEATDPTGAAAPETEIEEVIGLLACADAPPGTVGRKARRLAEALREGVPVPDGFCVTTAALAAMLEQPAEGGSLGEAVAARLRPLAGAGEAALHEQAARASEEIARLLADVPLPEAFERAVRGRVDALGDIELAVRSTAPGEDGERRSRAGHYDSFLEVRGADEVLRTIRRTLASFASPRAIVSAVREEGAPPEPSMAVLVQRLVRGERSGVLFTRSPTSEDADEMIVELVSGLGDALCDGTVTPERYRLPRGGPALADASGGPDARCLSALAELGPRVEALFGGPQDVEWSFDGERLWLLQTRPITARAARSAGRGDLWTAANSQEAIEDPVTPLTFSYLEPLIDAGRRDAAAGLGLPSLPGAYMRVHRGRIYFNTDYFRRFLEAVPGIPSEIFDRLLFGEAGGPDLLTFPRPRPSLHLLRIGGQIVRKWLTARARFGAYVKALDRRLAREAALELRALDDRSLLGHLEVLTRWVEEGFRLHVLGSALSGGTYLLLAAMLKREGGAAGESAVDELLADVPGVETAEASEGLFGLAAAARAEPGVERALLAEGPEGALGALRAEPDARPFLAALERFLARFGHLAEKQAELAEPRWREDPAAVLRIVRAFLLGEDRASSAREKRGAMKERKARVQAEVESALTRRGWRVFPWRRLVFRRLLAQAVRYAPFRENLRFHSLRVFERIRRVFLEAGRRLAERGGLPAAEDVFYLEFGELVRALQGAPDPALAERAAERHAERLRWFDADAPKFVYDDGTPAFPERAALRLGKGRVLEGVGVSGGTARGRVHKARTLEEALAVPRGAILVARAATPAWTPSFFLAAGVVLDIGGMLSHCAVIAREYGIPCVVGTRTATTALEDGAVVTVDADAGRVYLPA